MNNTIITTAALMSKGMSREAAEELAASGNTTKIKEILERGNRAPDGPRVGHGLPLGRNGTDPEDGQTNSQNGQSKGKTKSKGKTNGQATATQAAQAAAEQEQEQPQEQEQEQPEQEKIKHSNYQVLLELGRQRVHTFLYGPTGSGKSTAAHMAAQDLGLPFYTYSCGGDMEQTDITGFRNANGNYVPTSFYRAYTQGGVMLIDEIDAGKPGSLIFLNTAVGNGWTTFPEGNDGHGGFAEMHPDFWLVVTGNTNGSGATSTYHSRQPIETSTRYRFFPMYWGYDEETETAMAGLNPTETWRNDWLVFVRQARKFMEQNLPDHPVSPVATKLGIKLLKSRVPVPLIVRGTILNGISDRDLSILFEQREGNFLREAAEDGKIPGLEAFR